MAETKVTSIRADEETTAQFKAVLEQFPNAGECLKALMNAHEMEQAKRILTGQETSISDFQVHADSLVRAYINVLDLMTNAESRIREEFRERLESKDKTILELQERVRIAEQLAQTAQEQATAMKSEMSTLSEEYAELIDTLNQKVQSAEKRAEEMTESASTAKELISSLKEQLDSAKKSASEKEKLEIRLVESEQEKQEAKSRVDELLHQLEHAKKSAEQESLLAKKYAEIEKEKAVLMEREKSTTKIQELTEKINHLYEKIASQGEQIQELMNVKKASPNPPKGKA